MDNEILRKLAVKKQRVAMVDQPVFNAEEVAEHNDEH